MNLIEQLGGYEKAASLFNGCPWDSGTVDVPNPFSKGMLRLDLGELRSELLEYRRQHNIYEVGDIAVNSRGDESRLLKIWRVDMCAHNSKMSIADYDAESLGGWSRFHALRHATDEEIKAGRRLPVIESETVVISATISVRIQW